MLFTVLFPLFFHIFPISILEDREMEMQTGLLDYFPKFLGICKCKKHYDNFSNNFNRCTMFSIFLCFFHRGIRNGEA